MGRLSSLEGDAAVNNGRGRVGWGEVRWVGLGWRVGVKERDYGEERKKYVNMP